MEIINKNTCFILVFGFSIALSSCNVTERVLSKTHKKYEKLDLSTWTDQSDSSSIFWRKVGHGNKNLLLIHGFGAATELQWEGVVNLLQDEFTMYIPDLIYFGESTSKVDIYDPKYITRQLHLSIQKENIGGLYIAGISFGGLISSLFADQYPDEIRGLLLIDALSKFSDRTHSDSLAMAYGYHDINEILIPNDGKSLKTLFKISYEKPKNYPAFMLNKPARVLYNDQRQEKENLLNYLRRHEKELKSDDYGFDGPVAIIWGKEDKIIPLANAYLLQANYPNSTLTILPGVGHVANMEGPEEVANCIRLLVNTEIKQ